MWKNIAQALGLNIPEEQLAAIAPILDSLSSQARQALDRDLSGVDPALTFHPDLGART